MPGAVRGDELSIQGLRPAREPRGAPLRHRRVRGRHAAAAMCVLARAPGARCGQSRLHPAAEHRPRLGAADDRSGCDEERQLGGQHAPGRERHAVPVLGWPVLGCGLHHLRPPPDLVCRRARCPGPGPGRQRRLCGQRGPRNRVPAGCPAQPCRFGHVAGGLLPRRPGDRAAVLPPRLRAARAALPVAADCGARPALEPGSRRWWPGLSDDVAAAGREHRLRLRHQALHVALDRSSLLPHGHARADGAALRGFLHLRDAAEPGGGGR
mmetsp:Transcript_55517/g.140709  ORF Transcript_55517/g.140709 Transcript_55517/m.140709 type:complete len:267 (-) Transcript_55517:218-1018(-)